MAVDAQQHEIFAMVLRRGAFLILGGIAVGLAASIGLTRFLRSQIWGMSATDPWTFFSVLMVVILAGLAACFLPALRATRVDPLVIWR
jgi:putative ABC transport system permease protein